jgi:protein-L-isoaspartate(D-aspartate) O-methyltransferase
MEPEHTTAESHDPTELRAALVDKLKEIGCITTARVEAAFRTVPRHLFLPDLPVEKAYRDEAFPTKWQDGLPISSSSQPAIMAVMLEQLDPRPGAHVLEIGAGTGYNAALLAHLVGVGGEVVTLDIDDDIVEGARAHLAAAGVDRVRVVCADGALGWPAAAPYDRIILTVGAWDIAPAWREQLRPGGRLVLPLSIRGVQKSIAFEQRDDCLTSVATADCGFMRLRGAFAGPEGYVVIGEPPRGLAFMTDDKSLIDAEAVSGLIAGPFRDRRVSVRVTPRELFGGLGEWLALRVPGVCRLHASGDVEENGLTSCLFRFGQGRTGFALVTRDHLCVLARLPVDPEPVTPSTDSAPFDLWVRSFGPNDEPIRQMVDHVLAWDRAGRPASKRLRVRAYPADSGYIPASGEAVVPKRWSRLVLDWP